MANPLPALSDSELAARIRAGDEGAFELVFHQHYPRLCAVAARMTGSDALAEELVQDVFLRIWEQRQHWDVTTTIGGYLTMAVRNRVLNWLSRERLERQWYERERDGPRLGTALQGSAPTPDDELRAAELSGVIAAALDQLSPRARQAYVLRRFHRLSYAEIAQLMHITPKTVEIHIGRALKVLQDRLADWR